MNKKLLVIILGTLSTIITISLFLMSTGSLHNPEEVSRRYHENLDSTAYHSIVAQTIIEMFHDFIEPKHSEENPLVEAGHKPGEREYGGGEGDTPGEVPPITGEGGARIASAAQSLFYDYAINRHYYYSQFNFTEATDCSHFVCDVLNSIGIRVEYQRAVKWYTNGQVGFTKVATVQGANAGISIAQPGDIFARDGHVMIYAGNGKFWSWGGYNNQKVDRNFPNGNTNPTTSNSSSIHTIWRYTQ